MAESSRSHHDCVVVGASFAGLACARVLARAGLRVMVLEKKSDPGEKSDSSFGKDFPITFFAFSLTKVFGGL